jgi:para-nitrobenzyl esterase
MHRTIMKHLTQFLTVPALLLAGSHVAGQSATTTQGGTTGPVVSTEHGSVRGKDVSGVRQFLGVRYGAPPTGQQRWRPTRAPARWNTTANATQFGPHCPQVASPFGTPSVNEDCLFLNVYAPTQRSSTRRPVMVWIHGGALQLGQSEDYNPAKLVARGVVVVTINYRLGALGFLAHPALTAESGDGASGNYGLMDQQFALRWVSRNIANFGGDPDNVTIFGESAGGLSVHAHLASPRSANLFDAAIAQSGSIRLDLESQPQAEAHGTDIANRVGCESQTLACLRSVSVENLLANQLLPTEIGFFPHVDNKVLTQSFRTAFATGSFNRVPVIEGSTKDEWRLFVALTEFQTMHVLTAEEYPFAIQATLGVPAPVVPLIVAQYPLSNYDNPSEALGAVGTDAIFACNTLTAASLLSQHTPTWFYEFNDPQPPMYILPPASFDYGAYHASEIPFVLDVRPSFPPAAFTPDQQALSADMIAYWSQFARNGNPNGFGGAPFWIRFNATTDWVQSLLPPEPVRASGVGYAAAHKCDFWAALAAGGSGG